MKKIYLILTLFIAIFCFYLIYTIHLYHKMQPYNQVPLTIRTFDNSNSPYHPSVLYFEKGWNGYKYWMAETPYSPQTLPYRDKNECPSIHYSNNGVDWEEKNNPIDNLNEEEVRLLNYFSDPHLVIRKDTIECWYRITCREGNTDYRNNVFLLRKKSHNGKEWTERDTLISCLQDTSSLGKMIVSPAVIYKDDQYQMWYVNSEGSTRGISFSTSLDGKKWETKSDCKLYGLETQPWHIDVTYIDEKYLLTCYDFNDITLYESRDKINFHKVKTILKPSRYGSFYGNSLYRACLIYDGNYKLYFSSDDKVQTYIGLMEGKKIDDLSISTNETFRSLFDFLKYKIYLDKIKYTFILQNLFK